MTTVKTYGNANQTIKEGSSETIIVGNGNDNITVGSIDILTVGNGIDQILAGSNDQIKVGNGYDTITMGSNDILTVGNGKDTIHAGTGDTITLGALPDTIYYDGLTPNLGTSPLSVSENGTISLPITVTPALGLEVVNGFNASIDKIELDKADFANFDLTKNAAQVGHNTVITLDANDKITLNGVALSSLSAANFTFFTGVPAYSITITGVPTDATLSAGTNNGGGSWTLTGAQLAGLKLMAGEETTTKLIVTATNPGGATAKSTQTIALTVNPVAEPANLSQTTLTASGNANTPINLNIVATAYDADDTLTVTISGVPSDASLSVGTPVTQPDGTKTYSLTTAQLSGLQLIAGEQSGTLHVDVKSTEGTSSVDSTADIAVTVISDPPQLFIATLPGPPSPIEYWLGIAIVRPSVPSDTVSLTIAGLPADGSVSDNTSGASVHDNQNGSFTLTAPGNQPGNGSFSFEPVVNLPSGTVVADLVLTGTETNPTTHVQTNSAPFSFKYDTLADTRPNVTAVLQSSVPGLPAGNLDEGTTVPFPINFSPIDPLGDSITITGLPSDAKLSAGKNTGPGSWNLTPADLNNLTITTGEPTGKSTSYTGGVQVILPDWTQVTVQVTPSVDFGSTGGTNFPLTVYAVAPTLTITNDSLRPTEGTPIALGISETPKDPQDPITISITNVPAGVTLSAGTNNGGGSWTLTPAQLANLMLTVGAGAPATATFTVEALNTASVTHDFWFDLNTNVINFNNPQALAFSTANITYALAGVAPTLTIANNSLPVKEDRTVALGISETPFDQADPITVTITGVPLDATLSAGTDNGGGSWTLTPDQLAGLTLTAGEVPTTDPVTLTVTATNTGGQMPISTSGTIALTVHPIAPTLTIADLSQSVSAGGMVPLGISVTPFDLRDTVDPHAVTVDIAGIPSGATLSDSIGAPLTVTFAPGGTGRITGLTPAQLDGLTLTAGAATTTATLIVAASNTTGGEKATSTKAIKLTVNQLTAPTLTIANNALAVNENGYGGVAGGGVVALGISETPSEPSDVVSVTITGVPSDASLSAGTNNHDGSWTLTPDQLAGLTLTAGEVPTTPVTLTVTATNTSGTTASASQTIALTVNPVAPKLSAPASLTVIEDGSVPLGISVATADTNDTVSVTIAGVPSDASLSAGTNNGGGSWTLTPAQLAGLTLNAGEVATTTLFVAATNTEGATATSSTQTIPLTVKPHAPTLTIAHPSVQIIGSALLGISVTPFNSRDAVSVQIAGVPSGASLTDAGQVPTGTNDGGGIWTVSAGQLSDLFLTDPTFTTPFSLTVTAINDGVSSAPQTIGVDAPVLSVGVSTNFSTNGLAQFLDISVTPNNSLDNQSVTISGIPTSGVTFSQVVGQNSAGPVYQQINPTNGSITFTYSPLSGLPPWESLTFAVDSLADVPQTPLTVTATETISGTQVSAQQQQIFLGNSTPASVSVSVEAPQPNDPVTETRLRIHYSGPSYPNAGLSGAVNELKLSGVPTDVSLQAGSGWTLSGPTLDGVTDDYTLTGGFPSVAGVDVIAPSGGTKFNLGITAVATAAGSANATTQATTSQNIEVDYGTVMKNATFAAVNQSIWGAGSAFVKSWSKSLFVTLTKAAHHTVAGYNVSGTALVNAGLQADLNLNSGSFNGTLPFQVELAETYNKTNDTLQIVPTVTEPTGGSFTTTGPGGNFSLDFILNSLANLSISGPLGTGHKTVPLNTTVPLVTFNSTNAKYTIALPKGIGSATVQWPQVNTKSSTTGMLTSAGTSPNPIVQGKINPIQVLADLVYGGKNPLQGSFLDGHVNYTLLNATVAPGISLKEIFSLAASLDSGTLTGGSLNEPLTFGTPGTPGTPLVIDNASSQDPGLGLNLSLTPDAKLDNELKLAGQLILALQALAGNLKLTVAGHGSTPSFGPLVTKSTKIPLGTTPPIFNKSFAVAFQPQTVTFQSPV
jgi:hypothetical protein